MTHASYNQISDDSGDSKRGFGVLHVLGRIAFPLFCFLIVEGFLHTHDIKRYLRNMLVFAIIAEPIYDFVQTGNYLTFGNKMLCVSSCFAWSS